MRKPKHIQKKWVNVRTGFIAVLTDAFLVFQCLVLIALYALAAFFVPIFFYVSLALTAVAAVALIVRERDKQVIISWLTLFLLSFGCGFIIYLFADKSVCYGLSRRRYAKIEERAKREVPQYSPVKEYKNTAGRYFADTREFFEDVFESLERAEKFIFVEFFIVADGQLFERFLSIVSQKVREGVKVYLLADDAGCQGMLSKKAKKRIKSAGVNFKTFSKLFAPFSFKLNFRDHRKIIVVDGKTGYVCGCNIFDPCVNLKPIGGVWKDAGLRMDGAAVDGLSIAFIKNWEFTARESLDYSEFLNLYDRFESPSEFVPYAGGPEIKEDLCRGVYKDIISGAREKLFIMTPYFVPDGEIYSLIAERARAGADVRLVLPAVPDYMFLYRVTKYNADKLIRQGVKVYYVPETFLHSKVFITESCAAVGSVNVDMRAFYEELDNGICTDDGTVLRQILDDFESVFSKCPPAEYKKPNVFSAIITAILKLVSPLM